ncbi:hypothetical protein N2601_12745 [Rhizobium sp. CB3060]|uniref:hypothetical protein n=1 Tax=Rhizobium sp. CB3060 TaxID=3138255 RepID=UPI0021A28558|nr:hypothetical protein [Rhizobium tropici]UWU20162.1 hypothetical protein N2601_12745 [Rhizobium tropici]
MNFQNKKTIQKVSGNIGSRKTLTALQWLDDLVEKNMGCLVPTTIATPTNGLSRMYRDLLEGYGIPCLVISQDEGFRSASEEYARQCEAGYEGVLIVHHSIALNAKTKTFNRILIHDEAVSPIQTIRIKFKSPEDLQRLSVQETPDVDGYYELVQSDVTEDMVEDAKDYEGSDFTVFGKKAQELGWFANNGNYRVVVDRESFDKAASGEAFAEYKKVILQFTIFMHSTIVNGYKDTLFISAEFDKTMLGLMWAKDVDFQSNEWIESRLDNDYLSRKAPKVELYHAPVPNLSKTFFKRLGGGNRDVGNQMFLDHVADCLGDMFPGKKHIVCTNEPDKVKRYSWKLECPCLGKNEQCQCEGYGKRVIINPHGWNHLQDYDMGVFLAGINFDPITNDRLSAFYEITKEQAKEALCYQMVLQFLGRTSLRNKDSDNPIILVAPDEGAAAYIQRILGCAESKPLPIDFTKRPRKTRSDKKNKSVDQKRTEAAERQRKSRAAKKAAASIEMTL